MSTNGDLVGRATKINSALKHLPVHERETKNVSILQFPMEDNRLNVKHNHSTHGDEMVFERTPGDAANNDAMEVERAADNKLSGDDKEELVNRWKAPATQIAAMNIPISVLKRKCKRFLKSS